MDSDDWSSTSSEDSSDFDDYDGATTRYLEYSRTIQNAIEILGEFGSHLNSLGNHINSLGNHITSLVSNMQGQYMQHQDRIRSGYQQQGTSVDPHELSLQESTSVELDRNLTCDEYDELKLRLKPLFLSGAGTENLKERLERKKIYLKALFHIKKNIFAMKDNAKSVENVVEELIEMQVCTSDTAHKIGIELAAFLEKLVKGPDDGANESNEMIAEAQDVDQSRFHESIEQARSIHRDNERDYDKDNSERNSILDDLPAPTTSPSNYHTKRRKQSDGYVRCGGYTDDNLHDKNDEYGRLMEDHGRFDFLKEKYDSLIEVNNDIEEYKYRLGEEIDDLLLQNELVTNFEPEVKAVLADLTEKYFEAVMADRAKKKRIMQLEEQILKI